MFSYIHFHYIQYVGLVVSMLLNLPNSYHGDCQAWELFSPLDAMQEEKWTKNPLVGLEDSCPW